LVNLEKYGCRPSDFDQKRLELAIMQVGMVDQKRRLYYYTMNNTYSITSI